MINAWSLAYDVLNGTLDENFPIKKKTMTAKTYPINEDDMSPCKLEDIKITSLESDEYDPIVTVGSGNTASAFLRSTYHVDTTQLGDIKIDTSNCPVTLTGLSTDQIFATIPEIEDPICTSVNLDDIIVTGSEEYDTLNITMPDDYPYMQSFLADNDESVAHHFGPPQETEKPKPDLQNPSAQKYQEDKGIAALKNYVTSTYQGHYTNENSDVQTLDLIHSVGDAEAFCRSNALKYLSRYDKKGSAKQDILKAMHYCLLLYYFSGNTKDPDYTNSRYETF